MIEFPIFIPLMEPFLLWDDTTFLKSSTIDGNMKGDIRQPCLNPIDA
jgi:hypothetical protein